LLSQSRQLDACSALLSQLDASSARCSFSHAFTVASARRLLSLVFAVASALHLLSHAFTVVSASALAPSLRQLDALPTVSSASTLATVASASTLATVSSASTLATVSSASTLATVSSASMCLLHSCLLHPVCFTYLCFNHLLLDVFASTVAPASTWSLHRLYQLQLRYLFSPVASASTRCLTAVIARSIDASASTLAPSPRQLDVCSKFRQSSSLGSHLFHYFNDLELLKQHSLPVREPPRYSLRCLLQHSALRLLAFELPTDMTISYACNRWVTPTFAQRHSRACARLPATALEWPTDKTI
jgi:hypothetical protein